MWQRCYILASDVTKAATGMCCGSCWGSFETPEAQVSLGKMSEQARYLGQQNI